MLIIVHKIIHDLSFHILGCPVRGFSELFLNMRFFQICYSIPCVEVTVIYSCNYNFEGELIDTVIKLKN